MAPVCPIFSILFKYYGDLIAGAGEFFLTLSLASNTNTMTDNKKEVERA